MTYIPQRSLNGGEVSDDVLARIDLEKYQSGLRLCSNWIAMAYGGITNRSGMGFRSGTADDAKLTRLIPFEFNTEQTYMLAFGDQTLRIIKDGDPVLVSTAVTVSAITQATQGVVTATAHGLSDGDEVYFTVAAGMTELNARYFRVSDSDTNTFKLKYRGGSYVDTSGFEAFTAGTCNEVYEQTTPYLEADLARLSYTQSQDTLTVAHPDYITKDITRTAHDVWTVTDYATAPTTAAPTNLVATTSGTTDEYVVTAFDEDTGEESIASAPDGGNGASPVTLAWDVVAGANLYSVYKDENDSGVYGFIGLAETNSFKDNNISPDYTDTPPQANDPFDATNKYPAAVGYFEQRQMLGGTNTRPSGLFGSRSGLRGNHSKSTPAKPSDAFDFTLFSKQANAIRHLVDLTDLVVFTSNTIFRVKGQGDDALGPDSVDADPQVRVGSNFMPPLIIGATILYAVRSSRKVNTLAYKLDIDGLDGNEVTALVPHMFEERILTQWAYAEDPFNVIWCVTDDGLLLGLTFLPEHRVYAWHRHETDGFVESVASVVEGDEDAVYLVVRRTVQDQTRRYIERFTTRRVTNSRDGMFLDSGLSYDSSTSIESIALSSPPVVTLTAHGLADGTIIELDEVVGCTELNENTGDTESAVNGKRFVVNSIDSDTFELHDLDDVSVDDSGWSVYVSAGVLRVCTLVVTGADHLEGETVGVVADGNVLADRVVSGGAITLDEASARVHVGLRYTCVAETLPLSAPSNLVENALQGVEHSVPSVDILVRNTRGVYAEITGDGEDLGAYLEERTTEDWNEAAELFTGVATLPVASNWKPQHRIRFTQQYPLPATLLSITPEVVAEE